LRNVEITEKKSTDLNIRTYEHADLKDVTYVWQECGLLRREANIKENKNKDILNGEMTK
jgi:hypothetical protein